MIKSHGLCKRAVSLDCDVVLLTKDRDCGLGVEGMHFNLIDGRLDFRIRVQEFLKLQTF